MPEAKLLLANQAQIQTQRHEYEPCHNTGENDGKYALPKAADQRRKHDSRVST
jgi:hypothetical protein